MRQIADAKERTDGLQRRVALDHIQTFEEASGMAVDKAVIEVEDDVMEEVFFKFHAFCMACGGDRPSHHRFQPPNATPDDLALHCVLYRANSKFAESVPQRLRNCERLVSHHLAICRSQFHLDVWQCTSHARQQH